MKRDGDKRDETRQDEAKLEARNKVRIEVLRNNTGFEQFTDDRGRFTTRRIAFSFSIGDDINETETTLDTHHTDLTYTVFQRRKTTNDSNQHDNVSRTTVRFPQILRLPCLPSYPSS